MHSDLSNTASLRRMVESSPPVAEAAREVVRDNGLADRVEVVTCRSTALDEAALGERADVLVSEIVDVGLLGEGVLPTLRHALAQLVEPGARIVPAGATVHAFLLELPDLARVHPLRELSGFDLSAFDRFRVPDAYQDLDLERTPYRRLSVDVEVARYDLRSPPPAMTQRRRLRLPVTGAGVAHAVALWFELHLDEAITISTAPGSEIAAWGQAVQFLERHRAVAGGDELALDAVLEDTRIRFEAVAADTG